VETAPHQAVGGKHTHLNDRFAPTMAIEQECFYRDDASLLTDQSKSTNHNPWQGNGNLIVMRP
jgi:hypothetical protein